MKNIYLDNNATTKVDERVLEKMLPFLKENYANPSSMYDPARLSAKAIEIARKQVGDLLGVSDSKNIIFTSCATESANTAIKGVVEKFGNRNNKNHIITTQVEHPCVLSVYENYEKKGFKATYLGVDENGDLDIENLLSKITPETFLVSIMHANNETGAVYPVKEIAKEVKKINKEIKFFTDGVQAAGKVPIELDDSEIDFYSISGHKFHSPKGVGALYVKKGNLFEPFMLGGHQENSLRAGTQNTPYIVGLGEAARLAKEYLSEEYKVKILRDKLENGILSALKNARLNSRSKQRVPNTTNIGFEYIEGELILLYLNDIGIYASSGSACTSGSLDPSHVLRAQKVPFTSLHGSIRFSLSRYTTEEEINYTIEKVPEVIKKLAKISPFQKELNELGL